jgi:predicted alpha/beta-hydrolase family hydrolase
MTRRLRIQWAPGEKVTARLSMPAQPRPVGILLAHGAGAGQDHPWMVTMRDYLASSGFPTMTFNYAYTEAGRKGPDRPPKLLAVHGAAADRLAGYVDSVVLAGKSMGGRIASHLVGDTGWPAAAMVYLGYPLVAMGKSEPRPVDHLHRIQVPQLFISGTRDRLGPSQLIGSLARSVPDGRRVSVAHGDHSLRLPKSAGRTNDQVLADVAGMIADWILKR